MKISELFTEANRVFPESPGKISIDEIAEVKKAINKLKQSDTYQRMMELFVDVTRPVSLRNGTLVFEPKGENPHQMHQGWYKVNRNGQIRITNNSARNPSQTRLSSPLPPDPDLYTRYVNSLELIMKKYQKRREGKDKKVIIPDYITSLEEFDFPERVSSVTIKNNKFLKNLSGFPKHCTGSIDLETLPNLTSIEGLPSRIAGRMSIKECPELISLQGIPSVMREVYLYKLPKITSFSGIHKLIKRCNGMFYVNGDVTHAVLGLLKIPGIEYLGTTLGWSKGERQPLEQAIAIIKMFYESNNKDAVACQRKLIENDLDEYAEL